MNFLDIGPKANILKVNPAHFLTALKIISECTGRSLWHQATSRKCIVLASRTGSVSIMALKQVLAIAVLLGLLSEVRAELIEVLVPPECQSLAQEFGVPPVLRSKVQVTYALYKLRRIDGSHSGVAECRAAVERVRAAYRAQKAPVPADRATVTVKSTELPEQR